MRAARPARGAWNPAKVAAFEKAFWTFVRHVRINSKEKGGNYRVGQHLYEGQKRYLATIWGGLAEDKHDFKFLKSRQLGISTISELIVTAWLGFHDGMQGAMVFDTAAHSAAARVRIRNAFGSLPESFGFPRIQSDNRDGFVLTNQSVLQFMSAGVRESRSSGVLGRSTGFNLLWASEICSWENTEGIEALRNALSYSYPDRLYIWESTARGFNVWHDIWTTAKANPLDQVTAFFGWWSKDDQRLERDDRRWELYGEPDPTARELKQIQEVKDLYNFDISREQLAWYRWRSDPAIEDDEEEPLDPNFLQDQPWDESECFQQSGVSFFRNERLTEDTRAISTERPTYHAYRFWPGTDFISCDVRRALTSREIEMKVWEDPVPDSVYVVSTDPAYGRDEENDNSAIEVIRCYADGVDQVAEYASANIEPHQLSWLILTLLGWYGAPTRNKVLNICELNGPGNEVWRHYSETVRLIRQGYMQDKARERGLADIYHNITNFIYTKPDSMSVGSVWQFKCLALDTELATPDGWTTIGNVKVGDSLFDEFGQMCRVTAVSGVKLGSPCFRVTFDDRSSLVADADHVWKTSDGILRTTSELRAGLHRIPVTGPLDLPETNLPIDPYVLGLWLGDGNSRDAGIYGHSDDVDEVSGHITAAGYGVNIADDGHGKNVRRIGVTDGLWRQLRGLGLFNNKHIPELYLRASFEQRLSLLQGLMDTDGTIALENKGQCAFYTSSEKIADGFSELVRSLGIKAKYLTKIPTYEYAGEKRQGKMAYQFQFTPYPEMPVFRLGRKASVLEWRDVKVRVRASAPKEKRWITKLHHITLVEPVPSVPVRCIAVDSPLRMFLAGRSMVPTHNTNAHEKVTCMEGFRNHWHNYVVKLRSLELIEEMRTVARKGDSIRAPTSRRDDRTYAMAMAIRGWEDRMRRELVARDITRENDRIRRVASIPDRQRIFHKMLFEDMFKKKASARMMATIEAQRRARY